MKNVSCDHLAYISAVKWVAGVLLTINIAVGTAAFQMLTGLHAQLNKFDSRIDSIERVVVEVRTIVTERTHVR